MTVRRLAAFGLAAAIMHLNVARADVACAPHADVSVHAAHADVAGVGQPEQGPSDANCDAPNRQACCVATVSCSVLLGISGLDRVLPAEEAHDAVLAANVSVPASRVAAPDPPPPRR